MKIGIKKALDYIAMFAIPAGVSAIAYIIGLREGIKSRNANHDKAYADVCTECDGYMYRLENLTDTVNEFSKKTGIDITKEAVVLENDEALNDLADTAINEHGFGREGARDYNFKIISIAQKSDD